MIDEMSFKPGVRVEDRVGNRGTVIEEPWKTVAGWVCKIAWDSETITASGTTNERIVTLTIVR